VLCDSGFVADDGKQIKTNKEHVFSCARAWSSSGANTHTTRARAPDSAGV